MPTSDVDQLIDQAIANKATDLYLSFQGLTTIPTKVFEIKQLEVLVLTGNNLTWVPEQIGQLQRLKTLDLSGNQIMSLPKAICLLKELRQFEIVSNKLASLPDDLGELGNLQVLDVFGNDLKTLPSSLGRCHNLQALRAGDNSLALLPNNLAQLSSLEVLDISYNEVQELPLALYALSQLKELYLTGNKLDIPFDILNKNNFQPAKLLENIKAYRKNVSQAQAQKARQVFEQKLATFEDKALAEDIVMHLSRYSVSINGLRIIHKCPVKNRFDDITEWLAKLNQRISDICTLNFTVTEQLSSTKMDQLVKLLKDQSLSEDYQDFSKFLQQVRGVSEEQAIKQDMRLNSITYPEDLQIDAVFKQPEDAGKLLALWFALLDMINYDNLSLATDLLPRLEATLIYIFKQYFHDKTNAPLLARGFVWLLMNEFCFE